MGGHNGLHSAGAPINEETHCAANCVTVFIALRILTTSSNKMVPAREQKAERRIYDLRARVAPKITIKRSTATTGQKTCEVTKRKKVLKYTEQLRRHRQAVIEGLLRKVEIEEAAAASLEAKNTTLTHEKERLERELNREKKMHQADIDRAVNGMTRSAEQLRKILAKCETLRRTNVKLRQQNSLCHEKLNEERHNRKEEGERWASEAKIFKECRVKWAEEHEKLVAKFEEENRRRPKEQHKQGNEDTDGAAVTADTRTGCRVQKDADAQCEGHKFFYFCEPQMAYNGRVNNAGNSDQMQIKKKEQIEKLRLNSNSLLQEFSEVSKISKAKNEKHESSLQALRAITAQLLRQRNGAHHGLIQANVIFKIQQQQVHDGAVVMTILLQQRDELLRSLKATDMEYESFKAAIEGLNHRAYVASQGFAVPNLMLDSPTVRTLLNSMEKKQQTVEESGLVSFTPHMNEYALQRSL